MNNDEQNKKFEEWFNSKDMNYFIRHSSKWATEEAYEAGWNAHAEQADDVDYSKPTPETGDFIERIDDWIIDLGQVRSKLAGLEIEINYFKQLAHAEQGCKKWPCRHIQLYHGCWSYHPQDSTGKDYGQMNCEGLGWNLCPVCGSKRPTEEGK